MELSTTSEIRTIEPHGSGFAIPMLMTLDDLQSALNVDLTDPNGQTVATNLITAVTQAFAHYVDFPLEQTTGVNLKDLE